MAEWWESAPVVEQQSEWWSDAAPVEDKSYTGTILPISYDREGNMSFDSNAGLVGVIKNAVMAPGRAMSGELQVTGPDGRTSPEAIAQAFNFASVFSPSTPGLRSGAGVVPGEKQQLRQSVPGVPTADDLYAAADENFAAMRESGVDYASNAVKSVAEAVKRTLEGEGFDAEVAGKTHRILDKLASPPEGSVASIKGLHSARRTFGKIAQNFNDPTDQAAASQVIKSLDNFIASAGDDAVVAGSPSVASSQLQMGNANYAAAKRSDLLTGIERSADLRAAASNSGRNTGNAIRQRVASALERPKQISGFSPEEIAALEQISMGTPVQNATRYVGNVLGGGGGLGQMLTSVAGAGTGFAAGGGPGAAIGAAAPMAIGSASKAISNSLTQRALGNADEMVRMRSPLYESLKASAPLEVARQARTEALIRALLMANPQNALPANEI